MRRNLVRNKFLHPRLHVERTNRRFQKLTIDTLRSIGMREGRPYYLYKGRRVPMDDSRNSMVEGLVFDVDLQNFVRVLGLVDSLPIPEVKLKFGSW